MKTTDFITEHNAFIAQDAGEMHTDHEVQMARADCYHAADYAIKLHKILAQVGEGGNLEGWVSEKITLANDYLRTVYEYLSYEEQEVDLHAMPVFALESAEAQLQAELEEGWKENLAGAALAGSMMFGGGAAHAQDAPTTQVDAPQSISQPAPLSSRFTPGIDFSSAPYTITAGGKEYKFAGRNADNPGKGQVVKVPAALVGVRGLSAVEVTLAKDGKYYAGGTMNEVNPHNYDSDEDYYAARNAPAKPRYRGTSSPGVNPDDEAYFREIFRKKRLAAQQAEREQDHDRLATGTNEGVAETMTMDDAMKVLRHYGAGNFKTTSNELHFYKNGQPFSVDLTLGADSIRSVSLSQLNQTARQLKGQGLAEDKQTVSEMTAGGTGAGGFATGAAGGTGKPGTGVPKRVKNVVKRLSPKIGTGIYK